MASLFHTHGKYIKDVAHTHTHSASAFTHYMLKIHIECIVNALNQSNLIPFVLNINIISLRSNK